MLDGDLDGRTDRPNAAQETSRVPGIIFVTYNDPYAEGWVAAAQAHGVGSDANDFVGGKVWS